MTKIGIAVLNFDQTYQLQPCLKKKCYEWIELTDARHTSSYCDMKALAVIGERLGKRKSKGISLLGSGNYHYVTYLFLSRIQLPFTLVLFDYHTDMLSPPCQSLMSCGSWVTTSIEKLPLLKHVVLMLSHLLILWGFEHRQRVVENYERTGN